MTDLILPAAQEKTKMYRDDEVTKAYAEINMQHARMQRTDASLEMRKHEPNVHIQSEVSLCCMLLQYYSCMNMSSKLIIMY